MPKGNKGRVVHVQSNGMRATTNSGHYLVPKKVSRQDIYKLSSMTCEYNNDKIEKVLNIKIIEEDRVPIADLD